MSVQSLSHTNMCSRRSFNMSPRRAHKECKCERAVVFAHKNMCSRRSFKMSLRRAHKEFKCERAVAFAHRNMCSRRSFKMSLRRTHKEIKCEHICSASALPNQKIKPLPTRAKIATHGESLTTPIPR